MSRVRAWAQHVNNWLEMPNVICVAMDRLLSHPELILPELARALGVSTLPDKPALPPKRDASLRTRLRQRLSRRPASTAIVPGPRARSHQRESFTATDEAFFEREAGDVLARLGYPYAAETLHA